MIFTLLSSVRVAAARGNVQSTRSGVVHDSDSRRFRLDPRGRLLGGAGRDLTGRGRFGVRASSTPIVGAEHIDLRDRDGHKGGGGKSKANVGWEWEGLETAVEDDHEDRDDGEDCHGGHVAIHSR